MNLLDDHQNQGDNHRFQKLINNDEQDDKEEKEDIDHIFDHIVGNGKWNDFGQWGLFAAIMLISYCGIFPIFMHVYAAYEPRHRCLVPVCDTLNGSINFDADWISFTSPSNETKVEDICQVEMLQVDEKYDPCRRYSINKDQTSCQPNSFNQTDIEKCTDFVYDKSVVIETLTTKFNMVCKLEYQQMLLGSIVMFG